MKQPLIISMSHTENEAIVNHYVCPIHKMKPLLISVCPMQKMKPPLIISMSHTKDKTTVNHQYVPHMTQDETNVKSSVCPI